MPQLCSQTSLSLSPAFLLLTINNRLEKFVERAENTLVIVVLRENRLNTSTTRDVRLRLDRFSLSRLAD